MIREMVKIDEELCDGCGNCIPNCHEGALQMIDGKARLVSDLMCDGLGACLGHCPQGAISIEKREAEAYNETAVMALMVEKGENTVVAHLQHLKDHNEMDYLREGVRYLNEHEEKLDFDLNKVLDRVHNAKVEEEQLACGCAGSEARSFAPAPGAVNAAPIGAVAPAGVVPAGVVPAGVVPAGAAPATGAAPTQDQPSALSHWPVQMHLINPGSSYFRETDLVLAADCVAFSLGNFHSRWLKGKTLAIACPKLDSGLETYVAKLKGLIDDARINTLTVMMMQVPCCGGLIQLVHAALAQASRKVPVKTVIVGLEGEILKEEWI